MACVFLKGKFAVFIYLNYNVFMKKKLFLAIFISLITVPCAISKESREFSLRKHFSSGSVQLSSVLLKNQSSGDDLTPSQQATFFYSSNEIKKAFDVLIAIPDSQRTPQDWLLLGNILQDQDKVLDAIFMYERAICLDAKSYKAYYNLANIYLEDEKPFMAIENYRKANRAKNDFPYAYYNLGCAYIQSGELKKAKISFLKAIELKNNEPDFYYNLAYVYKKLNKAQLSKQYLEFYNKLLEAQGN